MEYWTCEFQNEEIRIEWNGSSTVNFQSKNNSTKTWADYDCFTHYGLKNSDDALMYALNVLSNQLQREDLSREIPFLSCTGDQHRTIEQAVNGYPMKEKELIFASVVDDVRHLLDNYERVEDEADFFLTCTDKEHSFLMSALSRANGMITKNYRVSLGLIDLIDDFQPIEEPQINVVNHYQSDTVLT